jgi:transcriptional regulator with XRE-family HTH domain
MMPNTVVLHACSRGDAERDVYLVRLGSGIAAMRKRRRMTRKALASRLEVSTNRLGFWERGVYRPPADTLLKLLLVLEVSAAELLAAGEKALTRLRRHEGPETSEGDVT